ncbi:MAG: hypothetical protein ITG02_13805 [Patulibacter sp.]|nr:hypothetical protein [Patulibacter sp.]
MPASPLKSAARGLVLATAIGAGAAVAAPTSASAAGTNACDASALQLSLLGGAPLDPIHANPAYTPCVNADGTLVSIPSLLSLASVDAVAARTRTAPNSNAVSEATVAGVRVGTTGITQQLTDALLTGDASIVGQLTGVLQPILGPTGLDALVNGLVGTVGTNLASSLPDILNADVISATANAQCVNGVGQLSGRSQIAGLRVLGTGVDANSAANQLLTIDTANLRLGDVLDIDDLLRGIRVDSVGALAPIFVLLAGNNVNTLYDLLHADSGLLANPLVSLLVSTVVDPLVATLDVALDSAPPLNIPPTLLNARVVPNNQINNGDQLTQQALTLSVSVLNQPILAGTLAQARVGAGAPGCVPPVTPPPPPAPPKQPDTGIQNPDRFSSPEAEVFLQCSRRPVDLIDVYGTGGRTFIQGVAERKYVGKEATIYLREGKKKVGTVKVGEDGLFTTRVALPPSKIRKTNKARYYAVVEGKRTRALKFARRMATRGLTATEKTVTFRGRVIGPLQKRQKSITIKQRVGCKSYKTVATVKPDAKGRFTAKVDAPQGESAVIYRAQTRVGKRKNASRLSPTFTLPRVVGLR